MGFFLKMGHEESLLSCLFVKYMNFNKIIVTAYRLALTYIDSLIIYNVNTGVEGIIFTFKIQFNGN